MTGHTHPPRRGAHAPWADFRNSAAQGLPLGISLAGEFDEPVSFALAGQAGLDAMAVECEFRAPDPEAFAADLTSVRIGSIAVDTLATSELYCERTDALVQSVPWEVIHLTITVAGRIRAEQDGRSGEFGRGSMALCRSDAPFRMEFGPDGDVARAHVIQASIPFADLGSQVSLISHLTATPLRPTPMRNVADSFLRALSQSLPTPASTAAQFVEHAVVDLAMALIAEQVDEVLNAESVEAGTRLRVRDFILRRLPDPELGPDKIAASLNMSRRYLYRLFESEDTSVAAYIRQTRLEMAHARLADPEWAGSTITEIAHGLGFGGPDQFARAFKARYILSPSEYRRETAPGSLGIDLALSPAAAAGERGSERSA